MCANASPLRLGTIALLAKDSKSILALDKLISQYDNLILGRIGVPYRNKNIRMIVLIVEGTTDQFGAFSGRMGSLPGVKIKSTVF